MGWYFMYPPDDYRDPIRGLNRAYVRMLTACDTTILLLSVTLSCLVNCPTEAAESNLKQRHGPTDPAAGQLGEASRE